MARVLSGARRHAARLAAAALPLAVTMGLVGATADRSSIPLRAAGADLQGWRLEDVYKAVHQAWRGPGHMIPSREMADAYLRSEWDRLERARPGEALVETLVVGAPFLRLNMRPYRDAGGSIDSLLEAFIRSAATATDSSAFLRDWTEVGRACGRGELPFSRAAFDSIDDVVRKAGYPAIHHSAAYEERYRPAYRVLSRVDAARVISCVPGWRRAR